MAIIDCDQDGSLALETMERLLQAAPQRMNLIAAASHADANFLLMAMRAGCNDFLSKPIDREQLSSALARFQAAHTVVSLGPQDLGRVISLFGAKGGVGTTTLAVHLAMQLVRKQGKKVLLIDHKHELGHVALHLGLQDGIYFFSELVQNVDRLDADLLDGFVTHHISGLDVIASPDHAAPLHDIPPGVTERVMDYLRTRYDFIVLDSSVAYSNTLASLVVASDEICLVSTPDVAALRDLVRHTEHLAHMKGSPAKLRIIINRSTAADAVNAEQIQAAVKFPVAMAIPNSYLELVRAVNAGEPVPPQDKGPFIHAIDKWAQRLTTDALSTVAAVRAKKRFTFWRQSA
ncbi:Type II/IV secretion system ATPase TadZ/CpaE, associated with Flp pilus assembly [Granulicella sibirica]|uniref:Type II/IV secretion system ATPase TadZ/CpaE, associated with Flp pilus assembly n=1 Tax=Granulicella sibirica TaxID=2479048 RepID=A0A4Q0SWM2_9BACT|nr:Type II/IV secretion system ATPase TadZ/CpaE, associated with Flp pilus assembly [Granulicella sibirica]